VTKKDDLRAQHTGMILNLTSKRQEDSIGQALMATIAKIKEQFGLTLTHEQQWWLRDVIERLRSEFPDVDFADVLPRASMRPDGGILSVVDKRGIGHPILIAEVKNQGTNDLRALEGLVRQARGNAIERLGKNVIGFRAAMLREGIMPFVCFGYGCDFSEDSSILGRVITIAMFGPLNEINVVPEGTKGQFNRGSYFFREEPWTVEEMTNTFVEVARRSIHFYFAKYGSDAFESD